MSRGQVQALREELWDAGFRPIAVYNINAKHPSPGKAPFGNDWVGQARLDPPAAVRSIVDQAMNTGILCDGLRGLDLDLEDGHLVARIRAMAFFMLGETLVRVRENSPRCLLLYAAKMGEPPKRWIAGTAGKVEVLGRGQQFVAAGLHPSGATLRWIPEPPNEVTRESLPAVTEEQIGEFLRQVAPLIGAGAEKGESTVNRENNDQVRELIADLRAAGAENVSVLLDLKAELITRFEQAMTERPMLRARWNGVIDDMAAKGRDTSRSGCDFSLAALLKGVGFAPRDTALLLLVYPHGTAFDDLKHPDAPLRLRYVARTALRASAARNGAKPPPSQQPNAANAGAPVRRGAGLPAIRVVAGEIDLTATVGEDALIASGQSVFRRDKQLVRPVSHTVQASGGRTTVAVGLDTITLPALIDLLNQAVGWERWNERKRGFVPCDPPASVAAIVLSRAAVSRLAPISGVITTPTLRPDGSLLREGGYDQRTRLFHVLDPTLRMPEMATRPTRLDADRALDILSGLLREFPFVGGVDRATALSAIITAVVRGALLVVPMHAFRASTAGSGKSYLADIVSMVATGQPCPVMAVAEKDEETEKRLVALLLSGHPIISLDNANAELGGDLLCQAIERPLIRVRPLGASGIVEIENRATLLANGNALRVRGDMTRRTLLCTLDAGMERPELRQFESDPMADIAADRCRYVVACLTIVRAYLEAGRPGSLPPIASFNEWSDNVRSALVWLGCDDPVASIEQTREDDPELAALREVLGCWKEAIGEDVGVTVRELIDLATRPAVSGEFRHPDFPASLIRVAEERGIISPRRLGDWLFSRKDRVVDGLRLHRKGLNRNKVAIWSVARVSN